MDIFLILLGILFLLLALVGCIAPVLPGPPLAYVAMLLLHFTGTAEFSLSTLGIWLALVIIVQLLDFIVPMLGTKYSGGSDSGKRGAIAGTILGLFFMPWGIVVGPFLGAIVGELIVGRTTGEALLSGFGSLLGFLFGTVLKIALCLYFVWEFIVALVS